MHLGPFEETSRHLRERLTEWHVSSHLVGELVNHHTLVNYPAGSLIFTRGAAADFIFLVLSGVVRIRDMNGGVMVALAGPGDIFGHLAVPDEQGRHAQLFGAQAFTKCSIALFSREWLVGLMANLDMGTRRELFERANGAWSALVGRWVSMMGVSIPQRLRLVLLELGERFGAPDERGTILSVELEHQDLADLIGASRSMVSRALTELTRQGFVISPERRRFLLLRRAHAQGGEGPAVPIPIVRAKPGAAKAVARRASLQSVRLRARKSR